MGDGAAIAHLRDGSPVGAWMLKANPSTWDIGAAIEAAMALDWWRLADNYRADLVAVGHPCVLWVTRGDPRVRSGIWAVGHVSGEVTRGSGDPDDTLWRDEGARVQVRPRVAVHLEVLAEPLSREDFAAHPDLDGAEILRSPRVNNPAALTPHEWAAVELLLSDALSSDPGPS